RPVRGSFRGRRGAAGGAVSGGVPASGRLRSMADDLTLMAVHAHPDDESSSTGGVLATYGDAGVRTVVVTCTNGEFGDAPGGVKPGQDGHDEQAVGPQRPTEVGPACKNPGLTDPQPPRAHHPR